MKVRCTKCKKSQKPNSFYKNLAKKNRLSSWCKDCVHIQNLKWRKDNPEKMKLLIKKWRESNLDRYLEIKRRSDLEYQKNKRARLKGYKTEESKNYRHKYPEKYKAQKALGIAVASGRIKRLSCEVCGENRKYRIHGHHDDYSEPYKVRWLCPIHHSQRHQELKVGLVTK